MKNFVKKLGSRRNLTRIVLPILLVIALALIGYFSFKNPNKNLDEAQAKTRAEEFINTYLMSSGSKASVKEISKEYGLYKLKIDITSSVVESYLTKDGKLFFPQALDVEKITNTKNEAGTEDSGATAPATVITTKSDKPTVELFVMSYCPYGTQIEKGILPVLETLGNKIDFELKFCNYAMHGEKELTENLLQYCLQKEQPEKLETYLACFLADGQSASCLDKAGVKKSKITSCVASTDKQYKVMDNFNNKVGYQGSYPGFDVYKTDNEKYGVGGSPTLIINGQEVSSDRDAASLLKTICGAFNNAPKECQATLSSASPSAGFGTGTAADSNGGCN
jgi:hypothetical protein